MILLFLAAAISPHDYYASGTTANVLLPTCEHRPMDRADFCSGYILASYDQLSWEHAICPGAGVSNAQIISVVLKSLNDHPEDWAKAASFLIRQSLTRAFPCSR